MKFFTSLRGQLTLAFLAVLALGLGLLLLLAANQMSRMTLESFTHEQQVLALIMANTLPMPLDEVHTQETLTLWTSQNTQWRDDLSSNTTISVYNLNGALVATSTDAAALYTPVSADLRAAASGEIVSKIAGDEVYVIVPILHDGRILLGTIALESPLEPVMDRLRSEWLALGGAAGLAMLLAVLAAVWLSARLTQPLSELRTAAERMADGHLDYRVRVGKSVREVASLGDMFNHMAEQVEAMIQEQRDFVANASHELRSPLAAIKLRAEALAMKAVPDDRAQQYAADINEEATQMAQLVGDLLQLSRTESGAFVPPEQPVHVVDELNACLRTVRPRAVLKHQQLDVEIQSEIPDLYLHSNDLRIMVGNLLDNAVKYTPEGGRIGLTARWQAPRLKIAISDSGVGIPPEDLPRISERFFRVDRAHTRNAPGIGLGLALVAATVRQYNGKLKVESTGVAGQGTKAYLDLAPRAADE